MTWHVDLAVVGGDEQRRVDLRQRVERPQRSAASNAALDGPCRWPDGVDPVPVEVRQARARRRAAPRPPRSSRTARTRAPASAAEPYGVSAIASGCSTGRRHALEELGRRQHVARVDRQRRVVVAGRAGTAAAGSRRRSTARTRATRTARAPRPAARCRASSGARWSSTGTARRTGSISSRRRNGWSAWRCTNAQPERVEQHDREPLVLARQRLDPPGSSAKPLTRHQAAPVRPRSRSPRAGPGARGTWSASARACSGSPTSCSAGMTMSAGSNARLTAHSAPRGIRPDRRP